MNATHDRLDEAIDQVAKRLTRVEDSALLANRILASLPDRSPMHWWAPRLAITTVLAIGVLLVVLRPFDERSAEVLRSGNASAQFVEFRAVAERTPVEPSQIVRITTVERLQNDLRTAADHERSLDAIASPESLALRALAPDALPASEDLVLEPLAIPDLPLTAEIISQR